MRLVGRYFQHFDEISGMSSSGEGTSPGEHSVHRAHVNSALRLLSVQGRRKMDKRQLNEEFLGVTVSQFVLIVVPLASFKEETIDHATTLRCLLDVMMRDIVANDEIVLNSIDGNLVLSRIVLESTGKESLGEEESREPELNGCTIFNPGVQEVNSVIGIDDPRS